MRIVYLHMLGGSARHWDGVIAALPGHEHLALDLPGFGGTEATVTDIRGLAWAVTRQLPNDGVPFIFAGHSMGAKVALATIVNGVQDGVQSGGLDDLAGLVTLAGSPPAPEPMEDDQRASLTAYAAHGPIALSDATAFLDQNTIIPLTGPARDVALAGIMAAAPAAWVAWLQRGSREDWAARTGRVTIPALIVAGAADEALGAAAQARMMRPHFVDATMATVPDAKHILPLEQPQAVADLIAGFIATLDIPGAYRRLLTSPRVSTATRNAVLARTLPAPPEILTGPERTTLAALIAHLLPGAPGSVAATVENGIAAGDGWRPAILPPDRDAYRAGLATLSGFASLDHTARDTVLGSIPTTEQWSGGWTGAQMRAWFDDVRDAAVRAYVSHPTTLAALRYSGLAYAGDGAFKPGFADPGLGGAEVWEP